MSNPIMCALDVPDLDQAQRLVRLTADHVGGFKVGMQMFYTRISPRLYVPYNIPLFLDLKIHDIPRTAAEAVKSVLGIEPSFLTVHAKGGIEMMKAAVAAAKTAKMPPKIIAVTELTSNPTNITNVMRLAQDAIEAGADGIVCSGAESGTVRAWSPANFIIMVPGIRLATGDAHDHKRFVTPEQAMALGADYLVIGRPITQAADPALAAKQIAATVANGG